MATTRVAPVYLPKTLDILNALGFKAQTYHCDTCGVPVIIEVVLPREDFTRFPDEDRFVCTECSKK